MTISISIDSCSPGTVGFDQIDQRRRLDGRGVHQVLRRLFQFDARLLDVLDGSRILDQRGSNGDVAQQQRGGAFAERRIERRQCRAAILPARRVVRSSRETRPPRAVFLPGGGSPHAVATRAGTPVSPGCGRSQFLPTRCLRLAATGSGRHRRRGRAGCGRRPPASFLPAWQPGSGAARWRREKFPRTSRTVFQFDPYRVDGPLLLEPNAGRYQPLFLKS